MQHRILNSLRLFVKTASKRTMSSSSNNYILSKLNNRTGCLTLNHPKALNSLNHVMISDLDQILKKWISQDSIDSLLIDSSVPKSFCAGGDIVAVTTKTKGLPNPASFFKDEYELDYFISHLNIPVTSIISGIVMGGGVGLSVHGRYRVATETTLFAMPEVSIGLFPDVGGSWFLPRLTGKLGWYLGMTGHRLKGADVFHAGIATHCCSVESLPCLKEDLMRATSPTEIESILASYHAQFPIQPFSLSQETLSKIDDIFNSATSALNLMQSLEGSKDPFVQKMHSGLKKGSPTSIAITFKLLEEGAKAKSLKECLNIEYNMVHEIMKRKDFYEGVRALLIDKDLSPQWSPDSIEKVNDIEDFFKNDHQLNMS